MESISSILVCGGTTEGRLALQTLDQGAGRVIYSTRSPGQEVAGSAVVRRSGALDLDAMIALCRDGHVGLIVDAAHPFAGRLHATVVQAAAALGIPAVRLERIFPPLGQDVVLCDDYAHACRELECREPERLLVLTGVQTISALLPYTASRPQTVYRVLDRDSSRAIALRCGVDSSRLIYYSPDDDTPGAVAGLIRSLGVDAVITKESGVSGGFMAKAEGARMAGATLFVVRRPQLPDGFSAVVDGPAGLRRSVEKLLPGFFPLRSGLTTGTCAVAAVRAALLALGGRVVSEVTVPLPAPSDGFPEHLPVPVASVSVISPSVAEAVVVKDAGDDPDVTDGSSVVARVSVSSAPGPVTFVGGDGIGTVTLPGTGLDVGEPAINPVPRAVMTSVVREMIPDAAVTVTISIPGGAELALKTFNPRIGIVGGLSVIGTTGIVRPFSHEAFVEAIRRELQVAVRSGAERVVINSGGRSENAIRLVYPDLPPHAFVHYGNAVGETLRIASDLSIPCLTIGMMIGKAVKLAEGQFDTHSHTVTMNRSFLSSLASAAGCSAAAVEAVGSLNMARELWTLLSQADMGLFAGALVRRCMDVCRSIFPHGSLEVMLITDSGEVYSRMQTVEN